MQERIGGFELEFCRGVEGKCPQALVLDGPNLLARIKNIARTSSWGQEKDLKKHHLFKIGFSACPMPVPVLKSRMWGLLAGQK